MTDANHHQQIGEILEAVLATPQADRDTRIEELCHGKAELIIEVKSLLGQESLANKLMGKPLFDANKVFENESEVQGFGNISIPGFRLIKVLGQGSSSIVYLAQQEDPRRKVAIKVLRPLSCSQHAAARIRAEAHLLARLEHSSIARVYQVGVIESQLHSQHFLVMEYVQGNPLTTFLQDHTITRQQRADLIFDICQVIDYAHKQGVVHRDIKPSNILITHDLDDQNMGTIKPTVIDFGIAKIIHGQDIPIDVQTLNPQFFGTLRYMSPERREGNSSGDAVTSDIYSVGVLATELFEGEFQSMDPVARVLDTMTDPDPAKRFATMQDASVNLRRALDTQSQRPFIAILSRGLLIPSRVPTKIGVAVGLVVLVASVTIGHMATDRKAKTTSPLRSPQAMTSALNTTKLTAGEDDSTKLSVFQARTHLISGHAKVGYHAEASRMIELTEQEFGNLNSFPAKDVLRYKLAKAYALGSAGNHQQAKQAYLQAKELIILGDDLPNTTANTWRGIAHGLQQSGDRNTARQMYQKLIEHPSFSTISWTVQSDTLGCSAGLYWLEQDLPRAEQMFRAIIDSAPIQLSEMEAISLAKKQSSLGVVLTSMGRYQEAEPHLNNAIDRVTLYKPPSDPTICRLHRNLAINHLHQGDYTSTISLMLYVRGVWNAMPDGWRYNLAEADFILGSAYLGQGDQQLALEHLTNAADLCNDLEGPRIERLLPRINNALGDALCASGSPIQGQTLLASSEPNLISVYGSQSPWTLKARERSVAYTSGDQ